MIRSSLTNVCLLYVEFPERPDALRRFLKGLHSGWNISLFHYRNHGAGVSSLAKAHTDVTDEHRPSPLQILGKCWPVSKCRRKIRHNLANI